VVDGDADRLVDPARLSALEATGLVDGPGLAGLDRLTALASQVLGVPVALSSLVTDTEQFFASQVGLPEPWATLKRTPLSHSFCRTVVTTGRPLIVSDAPADERVRTNLAIDDLGVIAYAGFPIHSPDQQILGSFCAIDTEPRQWTDEQLAILEKLSEAASNEIALLLANQELRRGAANLQDVLASAHDAYIATDDHGSVLEWNFSAERLFGWSRAEAIGADLADLIVPERYRSAHLAGIARVRGGGLASRRLVLTACDRTGAEFAVHLTLNVSHHQSGRVIHSFLHGITARQDGDIALRQEDTFLAAVLDSVDVGVAACGSDGRTALFNKAMRRIWGTAGEPASVEEWTSQVDLLRSDGHTPLGDAESPLARAVGGEPVRDFELVVRAPGVGARRFLCNGQPVVSPDGRGLGAVVALHDITERKRGTTLQAAQLAAAAALSEAASIEEGVGAVLHVVSERLVWAGAEFWQVDADGRTISRVCSWWTEPLRDGLLEKAGPFTFERGDGLAGAVWAIRRKLWIGDLVRDPGHFTRAAQAEASGLNSALALPVPSGERPGVLLFFAEKMPEPDGELSVALESICAHIGRFLERRRAEDLRERLARTREDFDRVIRNLDDFLWTVELLPDGGVRPVFAGSRGSSVFGGEPPAGTDPHELLSRLVHPDDRDAYDAFHHEMLAGRSAEIEVRVVGLDDVVRWMWTRGSVRAEGPRRFVDGITSNVSRRKQGEIELDEERRRLRQAQAIGRLGSWEYDYATGVTTWSDALYALYGAEPGEQTPDEAIRACVHPEDRDGLAAAFSAAVDERRTFFYSYRVIRLDDDEVREFELRGEPQCGPDGQLTGLVGTAMDVTERVYAQRELARREAILTSVLSNNQSAIYVKDLAGHYLLANQRVLDQFGVTEEELLGQDDSFLDPELAPLWQAHDRRALQGRYEVEEWVDLPDGRRWFDTVKFPLRDGEGTIYAVCGVSLDVTARRRAAEVMAEARDAALAANAAKSAFLATMSHEIRTPMNAVIGMTDLLLETDLDERQLEYVDTVRTSGDALLGIINDILDFSRIEAGEMELEQRPFDLRRCVEDALAMIASRATGIDLVAHVGDGCPAYVRGDVTRLRQVLVNLVGNAVKFTERGDVLVLVTVSEPPGTDTVGDAGSVRLSFSVRDTGIGIPPERMDRLFRSFSQVDASTTRVYGGSGLGLAISRAIVQAMGGDITVTSEVGVGSTFSFDLVFERAAGHIEAGRSTVVPSLSGCRALIVDDNDTNRRILRLQLEGWGMSCTDVDGAAAALAAIELSPRFDVAILDMNMPGADGVQLAESIRRLPAGGRMPLILLTSLSSRPVTADEELFAGFHSKPIRAEQLRTMLGDVLARRARGSGRRASEQTVPDHALRVLLAEDNLVNQKVAQGMLHSLGHQVDIASDGAEAVAAVSERDYDIVLMDIHMPTMDGLDAARNIRSGIPAQRQPHIVAMTASSLPEDVRAATDAGMNGYLLKPVRVADLAGALRQVPVRPREPAHVVPAEGTAQGAVDIGVLRQLSVDMGADSPEGRRMLIDAYVEQATGWVSGLVDDAGAGEYERIRMIAHTLGSSSALLGAFRLAEILAECGRVARELTSAPEAALAAQLMSATRAAGSEYVRVAAALDEERRTS
jgi:PAS domain S-box-containing protein